ncbi:MAG: zf-HC2 domain-containing protein [bacterium]
MKCKNFQNALSDYLDKKISDVEKIEFENHLKECADCSIEYEAMKLILSEASKLEKVKTPEYLWKNIEAQINVVEDGILTKISNKFSELGLIIKSAFKIPVPVIRIAGVAAVLLIGIVIGRYFFPGILKDDFQRQANTKAINYKMISSRTDKFIEKSKILFLGIINVDSEQAAKIDLSTETRIAHQLIKEASFLNENMPLRRNEQIRQLISELEMILLEIANMEEQVDIENIELIKSGIDRKSLLLKINLYSLSEEENKVGFNL